jgi:hypothetical protein
MSFAVGRVPSTYPVRDFQSCLNVFPLITCFR